MFTLKIPLSLRFATSLTLFLAWSGGSDPLPYSTCVAQEIAPVPLAVSAIPDAGNDLPSDGCCSCCVESCDTTEAPDFFYEPKNRLFKGKYTRIQDCQSRMVLRPGDEFWWVSTRHLPLQACDFKLRYYRFLDCQGHPSSLEELKTASRERPELVNLIYIHENRADLNKSEMRFWQNYNILVNQAPDAPPVRYIFFSWPADRIRGQIRDVKEKAIVCDYHAYYLAWFLCQIRDFNKPSLSGYSYGCRLGMDALHLAGGGQKKCQALPEELLIRKPTFRAAFVATAMQNGCNGEGGLCELSYRTLDHITLLNNSTDGVLKMFPLMDENGSAAIGREGICQVDRLPGGGQRLTQIDATCIAGRSHKLEDYYKSELLRQKIRDTLFWRELPAEAN
ncbi:MAG: hypothetical protein VX768_21550 [Planctomycetota bacterium]|nr:hypothetical protein [Planctomycetota bacterium]